MTDAEIADRLATGLVKLHDARRAYMDLINECFPVRSYVRWKERPYIQSGHVEGPALFDHSLLIRCSRTGRLRRVHVMPIFEALSEREDA